jgi:uncharacterized protein (UPF0276 family)
MSKIQLGIPILKQSYNLLAAGKLDTDYVVFYGQAGLENLKKVAEHGKPIFLHDLASSFWLNYENPFQDDVMTEARAMLDLAGSPWLSTGIGASAEPQAHRNGPYREADPDQLQPREKVIENIVKHGQRLREWAGIPLLLENFNYHPTNAYEYICEPELFSYLIDRIGCGMLLDLAHARISSHNMGWSDPRLYLDALPLQKIREVHVTRPGWEGDQMVDLHQPLQADDFELLGWVLNHAPVEAVTIELDDTDEATILAQIDMMRHYLNSYQR